MGCVSSSFSAAPLSVQPQITTLIIPCARVLTGWNSIYWLCFLFHLKNKIKQNK